MKYYSLNKQYIKGKFMVGYSLSSYRKNIYAYFDDKGLALEFTSDNSRSISAGFNASGYGVVTYVNVWKYGLRFNIYFTDWE